MALVGNPRTLQALKRALAKLPFTATARIAARSAPAMSELATQAFDGGESVYGGARPASVDGAALTLTRTGATRAALQFIATGRDIRLTRLPRYTKYLIGKYGLLPNGRLPVAWRDRITEIAVQTLHDELFAGAPAGAEGGA